MITMRPSFSMIELLIVIVLIGVIAGAFARLMFQGSPNVEWPYIQQDIEKLISFTRQEALSNQKIYRLVFQHRENAADLIRIEEENPDPENPFKKIYKPVISYFFEKDYTFPKEIKLKAVYLGRENLLEEKGAMAYCYIEPTGMIQEMFIQLVRKMDDIEVAATFQIDPFAGICQLREGFVRP